MKTNDKLMSPVMNSFFGIDFELFLVSSILVLQASSIIISKCKMYTKAA